MKYVLRIETSDPLKGPVNVPFNDRATAEASLDDIKRQRGGLRGFLGITTVDISKAVGLSIVEREDDGLEDGVADRRAD
jgi:hypothetical protein